MTANNYFLYALLDDDPHDVRMCQAKPQRIMQDSFEACDATLDVLIGCSTHGRQRHAEKQRHSIRHHHAQDEEHHAWKNDRLRSVAHRWAAPQRYLQHSALGGGYGFCRCGRTPLKMERRRRHRSQRWLGACAPPPTANEAPADLSAAHPGQLLRQPAETLRRCGGRQGPGAHPPASCSTYRRAANGCRSGKPAVCRWPACCSGVCCLPLIPRTVAW